MFYSVLAKHIPDDTECSAINIIRKDNVITRLKQGKYRHVGSLSTGKRESTDTTLQDRHGALKLQSGRIFQSAVRKTCGLPKLRMAEGRRLEDRHAYRAGKRLRSKCAVYHFGIKREIFFCIKIGIIAEIFHNKNRLSLRFYLVNCIVSPFLVCFHYI